MGKVKLYGSNNFTPNDLPGGVTLDRGNISAFYAGCLGGACCVPAGTPAGYTDVKWRTHTEYSYGGYFCVVFPSDYNRSCDPLTVMQNESLTDGIDFFTNNNNANKRLLGRAGTDIPDDAVVNYVRVWLSGKCPSKNTNYVRPYYQIIGTSGDPASGVSPGDELDKNWPVDGPNTAAFTLGPGTESTVQKSAKLLSIPSRVLNGKLVKNTGFGIRFGKNSGVDVSGLPSPGQVNFYLNELGIEIGYNIAQYVVTTDSAAPTSTSAVLFGTVNPFGDTSGFNFFQYGTTNQLGTSTALVAQPASTSYQSTATITGLSVNTVYYYRAAAKDSAGEYHYGEIKSFYTQSGCTIHISMTGA